MAANQMDPTPSERQYQSQAGCLLRLFWMFVGNIALVAAAFLVYRSIGWSIADLTYWLVIDLLIGARYIDIARLQGTTIHLRTGHNRALHALPTSCAARWRCALCHRASARTRLPIDGWTSQSWSVALHCLFHTDAWLNSGFHTQ